MSLNEIYSLDDNKMTDNINPDISGHHCQFRTIIKKVLPE